MTVNDAIDLDRLKALEAYVAELEQEIEETNTGLVALTLELEQSQERYRNIFKHSHEGIVITDEETRILDVNPAFTAITGYTLPEVQGRTATLLRSEWHEHPFYDGLWREVREKGFWQGEVTDRRKNGETYVQYLSIVSVRNEDNEITNFICIVDDITLKKESERKIHQLAYYDHLTKLPNRSLFQDRLNQAIRLARRDRRNLAVLFIDLDNFKNINDTLGHLIGDKFLVQVSETMRSCVREHDTVARLGGDEFIILLEELSSSQDASKVAKKIIERMTTPFNIDGEEVFSGASIGISIFPDDGHDSTTLVKHADTAMYTAKEQGKNDFRFFIDDMNVRAFERVRLENELRRALEEMEFMLYYQPRLELATEQVIGLEALARWNHPEMGMVPPFKFISLAEETGLIEPITNWALGTAFPQARRWLDEGLPTPVISVNISARQLRQRSIAEDILAIAMATGIGPEHVEIEVTESTVMADPEEAIYVLKQLKDGGAKISVDDFGTGYSSLAYLTRLPIDTVKIDKSFIHDLDDGGQGDAVVEAIIALAQKMNLSVVAEGVEKDSQADFLRNLGCDEVQGFKYYRPMPPDQVAKVIKEKGICPLARP